MSANRKLSGVAQTLVIPLLARAESQRLTPKLSFSDPDAQSLLEQVQAQEPLIEWPEYLQEVRKDRWVLTACILRAHTVDRLIQKQLNTLQALNRRAVVISLGAGLCTRRKRIQSPLVRWVELDLPEVISIKNQIDPVSPEENTLRIPGSLFHLEWLSAAQILPTEEIILTSEGVLIYFPKDEVETFFSQLGQALRDHPQKPEKAVFYFDSLQAIPVLISKWASQSIRAAGARLQWGLSHARDLEKLDDGYQALTPIDLSGKTPGILGLSQKALRAVTGSSVYQIQQLLWKRLP